MGRQESGGGKGEAESEVEVETRVVIAARDLLDSECWRRRNAYQLCTTSRAAKVSTRNEYTVQEQDGR